MKENVSTVFLLPGIRIEDKLKESFYANGFINTYLKCPPLEYPFPVIYILFKPVVINMDFIRFCERLQTNSNFLETLDAGKGKVLMVYKIPKHFKNDHDLFLKGKYSKMSKEYKECFILEKFKLDSDKKPIKENNVFVKEPTTFYHIFNRTEDMKKSWLEFLGYSENTNILDDVEFYEKPNLEKEELIEELWLG